VFLQYRYGPRAGVVLGGLDELGFTPQRSGIRAAGVLAQDVLVQLCRGGGAGLGVVEVGQVADRLLDVHRVVVAAGLLVPGGDVAGI